jgi:hypothetical protein
MNENEESKTFKVTEYEGEVLRILRDIKKSSKRTAGILTFFTWLICIVSFAIVVIKLSNSLFP